MATRCLSRSLLFKLSSPSSLSAATTTTYTPRFSLSAHSFLRHRRPISTAVFAALRNLPPATGIRAFSSRPTTSSLSDPNPNMSNRPPKETILLDGCDFEHWLVVMEKPEGEPTRDEIIDKYIKTLAVIVGSEEEARMKIYSVSTRCYFAFGALIAEEFTYKLKELPGVRWVLPDSYLDVKNKDYGGEPFINGQAVPYDPKYHEEWIRNNARAGERNRRNDRPRNSDRSRNFERRRENMENRDFSNRMPPQTPAPNMGAPPPNNMGGFQPNSMGGNPSNDMGGNPSNMGGTPSNYMGGNPSNMGGPPPTNNVGGPPPNYMGRIPPPNSMGGPPPPNMGRMPPPNNMGWAPPPNMGGPPPNMGGPPPNMGGPPPNMGGPPPNMGGPPPNNMGGPPPNNMGGPPLNNMRGMPPSNVSGMPQAGNIPNYYQNNGGPPGQGPNNYQNSYAQDLPGAPYQR